MGLFSLSNKQLRTSIIIKDHVIRYLDSKQPGSPSAVRSFGERYLPSGVIQEGKIVERDTLLIILEECVEAWKLKGRHILFCVPDSYVVIRTVQVPIHLNEAEIKGHLLFEIGESIHLPFENPVFDVHVLGERDGQRDILLFASPESILNEYTELLEEVKLKPIVADLSSLAIYRLYYSLDLASRSDHLLSIQFDIKTVNITIFHQFKPIFTRHFKLAVDEERWQLTINKEDETTTLVWNGEQDQLEAQFNEITSEVERVMSFYHFSLNKGKKQITKLLVTGDHSYRNQFFTICKSTFEVPVESIEGHLFTKSSGEEVPSRYYEALGLALKKEVP